MTDMRMNDLDAVSAFNAELQSLYDAKPPISKGKMTAVTRAALKGVKLYKHIIQSVEKFISKCQSVYKIPGLYVIDSIIRQSRHQFGAEKDVFAQRFAKNIQTTFMHLYKCPEEEKPKIIRVLNLWQKNKIFSPETIHPLFELADPKNPLWEQLQSQEQMGGATSRSTPAAISSLLSNLPAVPFKKEVLDYDYGDDDEGTDSNKNQSGDHGQQQNSNVGLDALGSILANPEILRQLANLQEQIAAGISQGAGYSTPEQERQRKLAELNKQEAAFDQRLAQTVARLPFAVDYEPASDDGRSRKDIDQNSNQLGNNQSQPNQLLPPPFFQQINDQQQHQHGSQDLHHHHQQLQQHQQQAQTLLNILGQRHDGQNPFGLPMPFPVPGVPFQQDMAQAERMAMFNNQLGGEGNQSFNQSYNSGHPGVLEIDLTDDNNRDKDRRDKRRKRSRERRSRSRSRPRRSRSRSRGKEGRNDRKRYRSRSRDRKEDKERDREKEKERMRKGLPPIKKEHLSVCTTTLWVGHLSKLVSQEDLSDTFGAYGDIVSIDLIPPRGCAFIVMNRRQDSLRALDRLKNTKLQGKSITVAWAPGKGMKGREWKDYWEIDAGVSYIPWPKLRPDTPIEEFEDGGCVDEDTLPDFLRNKLKAGDKDSGTQPQESENSQDVSIANINAPSGTPTMPLMSMENANPLMGDSDARSNLSGITMPGQVGPGGMPNAFAMPPVGMMPIGMVPPPMMGFPGMGGIPGMQMMMPPMVMGPGLLGDIPSPSMGNMSQHNNMPPQLMEQNIRDNEDDNKKPDRKEKRRSRFNDPDEIVQPIDDVRGSPSSQDGSKDDRPVFERLKSLAEGYAFGGGAGTGPSLLGNPGAMLGPRGPGPRGFPQSPLMPHGAGGNQFSQPPPGFMGDGPRGPSPMGGPGPRPWFDSSNPFLNPNQNPFAGNPFVQSNLTENPFEIGAPPPTTDIPQPLFGNRPERSRFGGWGGGDEAREPNREVPFPGGRNSVWEEEGPKEDTGVGRGRGRGGWRDDPDRGSSRGGGFRGRGRGARGDSWEGRGDRGNDREREDRRGRREDREDGSRDRDRRERNRSRDDSFRDNSRRSRSRRSSERQSQENVPVPMEEENWETDENVQQEPISVPAAADNWDNSSNKIDNQNQAEKEQWNSGGWQTVEEENPPETEANYEWEAANMENPEIKPEDSNQMENPEMEEQSLNNSASNDLETNESWQEENTCSQQNEEERCTNVSSIPQHNEEANLNFPDQSQNSVENGGNPEMQERTEEGNRNFSNFNSSVDAVMERNNSHYDEPQLQPQSEDDEEVYSEQEVESIQQEASGNQTPTETFQTSNNNGPSFSNDESQSQERFESRDNEEMYRNKNGDCSGNGDESLIYDNEENSSNVNVCADESSEQNYSKHVSANHEISDSEEQVQEPTSFLENNHETVVDNAENGSL